MSIWNFSSYREYLRERLGTDGARTGQRKRLAEAIPVHSTFVSQVLKGRAEFSLEQSESINLFFGHTEEEGECFILMVLKDRAGSAQLKARFERKIQAMRDARLNISKRLDANSQISAQDRERFYSSYIFGAVHVLTGIPQFRTPAALSEALRIPRPQIQEILEFMLRIGVLKEGAGGLFPGPQHVHLGNDSELILKHHANWRLHTLSNLQFLNRDDLHYSACVSLSRKDVFRVKESMLANLKSNVEIVSASPEEEAFVMSFDFYKLTP